MRVVALVGFVVMLWSGSVSLATSPTEVLGTCLTDSLDGKERKKLARWIFFSLAAHPEIEPFLSATAKDVDTSNRFVGQLVTRLLVEDCPEASRAAIQHNPSAIEQAFEFVGEVAMQEIMANDRVVEAIAAYAIYADEEKIVELMGNP